MRGAIWCSVIVVTLILQATIIPLLKIFDTTPDLLLILAVLSGMLFGIEQGWGS